MDTPTLHQDLPTDGTDGPMGPYVIEEPRIAAPQAAQPTGKPVTLSPAPPAEANLAETNRANDRAATVQNSGPLETTSTGVPFGVVPWAAAAILMGAALIAWAVHSRARAARAVKAVQSANTSAASADQQLADDMSELSDRIARELDARAQRLERLIATADTKIAELSAIEDRVARVTASPSPTATARSFSTHAELKPMSTKVHAMAGDVDTEGAADPGIAAIYQLADEGHTAVQIAQRTGRGTGQVELVLNLRRAARGG